MLLLYLMRHILALLHRQETRALRQFLDFHNLYTPKPGFELKVLLATLFKLLHNEEHLEIAEVHKEGSGINHTLGTLSLC